MTTIVDPYTFAPGTTALSSQINARFAAILAAVNGQIDSSNLASIIQHALFQAGDLKISGAATPPSGWLLCDGTAYSRTGYTALFGAISTNFGAGDGTSTFNVPDLRARVPIGSNATAISGRSQRLLGGNGGEENHTLNINELPPHSHDFTGATLPTVGAGAATTYDGTTGRGTVTQTGNSGGGGYHNNMQPFVVVNVFIFTGQ